jgi:hypothetical protein
MTTRNYTPGEALPGDIDVDTAIGRGVAPLNRLSKLR